MEESKYVMKESDRELLNFLFPDYSWIHMEPEEKVSLEDSIEYGGKYVIYGSKDRVEELVEELEPGIGDVIEAIKYSTVPVQVTPLAPENKYALIVYCNIKTRTDVMKILQSIGVKYFEWKSTRDSWREVLNDRWACLNFYIENRERFRKLCELVGREDAFEYQDGLAKLSSELAPKFKAAAELLHENPNQESTLEEIKELIEQI